MTRILLLTVFVLTSSLAFSQNESDFKYVIVPEKFSNFEQNEFRMNYHLIRLLEDKNYEILNTNPESWPEEVKQNVCLALKADVIKGKKFLKNKVDLVFTDCQEKEINRHEGISSEKNYVTGYPDALKNAVQTLRNSFPKKLDYQPKSVSYVTTPSPEIKIQGNISENSWKEKGIEFSNGNQTVILTELKDGSYILIQKDNSAIIAQLIPSSKEGIYHTTIQGSAGNYYTIGFYDGSKLSIEFKNDNQSYQLTEFLKIN